MCSMEARADAPPQEGLVDLVEDPDVHVPPVGVLCH